MPIDRQSHIGTLDKGLDEAAAKGWTVVSMKDDWKDDLRLRKELNRIKQEQTERTEKNLSVSSVASCSI